MTQDEILDALEDEREKLLEAIDGLSDDQMTEPSLAGGWSVKDVLHHLAMWEAEMVKLLWQAAQGARPTTIHFAHADVDKVNAAWHAAGKDRPLELVMTDFSGARKQTARRVEGFQDEDLNDPKRYPWLKGIPLWKWIAEDSFNHDAEHTEQIKAWRAARGY
jgi:uncharacterized protein (TIGR03083 family)